jgi:hypothetical protein
MYAQTISDSFLFQYCCYVEECNSRFATPQDRRSHCIEDHQFPHDFRFDDARRQKSKHCKSKHAKGGSFISAMEVDTIPGDRKRETSVNRTKPKPEAVPASPQAFEEFACGNDEKYESGSLLGEASSAPQVGRGMHTKGFGKPFSFVPGRGRYQRLGGMSTKFNSETNKSEQSSSSNSNVWGTSGLLDALDDAKVSGDGEKFASRSDAVDVKSEHD